MFNPSKLPEFPPEAEKILPADVWAKLQEIKASSASVQEKRCEIHKVMMTVPDEILEKLPEPKEFANLPADVKQKLKAIHRQKDLPLDKKKEQFEALVKSLPPDQQKLLVA